MMQRTTPLDQWFRSLGHLGTEQFDMLKADLGSALNSFDQAWLDNIVEHILVDGLTEWHGR